jgi:CDP-paratose 2-epimerase
MRQHYPEWNISKSLKDIFNEIHQSWTRRVQQSA